MDAWEVRVLDGIPATLTANAGAVGILAIAVLGVLRGWLVPGRSLDTMLTLHRERLEQETARGDEWRAAALKERERADARDQQTEKLLEVVSTTIALMETLKRTAQETR
jgi:hypothetical protein